MFWWGRSARPISAPCQPHPCGSLAAAPCQWASQRSSVRQHLPVRALLRPQQPPHGPEPSRAFGDKGQLLGCVWKVCLALCVKHLGVSALSPLPSAPLDTLSPVSLVSVPCSRLVAFQHISTLFPNTAVCARDPLLPGLPESPRSRPLPQRRAVRPRCLSHQSSLPAIAPLVSGTLCLSGMPVRALPSVPPSLSVASVQ